MISSSSGSRRHHATGPLIAAAVLIALGGSGANPAAAAQPVTAPPLRQVSGPVQAPATLAADASLRHPHRVPQLVTKWARAWNAGAPSKLASLFTPTATYQDFAFNATFTGRGEIAEWVRITHRSIDHVHVEVTDAFRAENRISVRWIFSGQIVGAPEPFSVPVSTVMETQGRKISADGDYYNLAEVLRQSGLPADTSF